MCNFSFWSQPNTPRVKQTSVLVNKRNSVLHFVPTFVKIHEVHFNLWKMYKNPVSPLGAWII